MIMTAGITRVQVTATAQVCNPQKDMLVEGRVVACEIPGIVVDTLPFIFFVPITNLPKELQYVYVELENKYLSRTDPNMSICMGDTVCCRVVSTIHVDYPRANCKGLASLLGDNVGIVNNE
jgi:DNA-directed RNA polymerase subunit E'/Rpb7